MLVYRDEIETLQERYILGTHFTGNQLAILTTEPGKEAYLLPMKFSDENEALKYYKEHLKEVNE